MKQSKTEYKQSAFVYPCGGNFENFLTASGQPFLYKLIFIKGISKIFSRFLEMILL